MKLVRVRVPATTANLGPGFDAVGMAISLWNEALFVQTDDASFGIRVYGEGELTLPSDERNLVLASALQLYALTGTRPAGFRIYCFNRIPLASGLGSSSAAMLTGLLGANGLLGEPFSPEEILTLAAQNEGHPDNVAPAMLGGLVAAVLTEKKVIARRFGIPPLALTVVLPDFAFPTQTARAILPPSVPRQDAIYNLARVPLVLRALETGDLELLGEVMDDRLHQPYRFPLIPGAQAAMEAARAAGAAAVALSGAGPALIAFSAHPQPAIGDAMQRAFREAGLPSRIFHLEVSQQGAQVQIWECPTRIPDCSTMAKVILSGRVPTRDRSHKRTPGKCPREYPVHSAHSRREERRL